MLGFVKRRHAPGQVPASEPDFAVKELLQKSSLSFFLVLTWSKGIVATDAKARLRHAKSKTACLCEQNLYPVVVAIRRSLTLDGHDKLNPESSLLILPAAWDRDSSVALGRVEALRSVSVDCLASKPYGAVTATITNSSGQYLCALPLDSNAKGVKRGARTLLNSSRIIDFSSSNNGPWEKFTLIPIGQQHVAASVLRLVNTLLPEASNDLLFDRLSSTDSRFKIQASLLNLRYPSLLAARTLPGCSGSPEGTAAPAREKALRPSLDWLGELELPYAKPRTRQGLLSYVDRLTSTPRAKACIVATACNEAIYLPHWCSYHWSIGFDHIFLYTNNNDDATLEVARRLSVLSDGKLTVIPNLIADPDCLPQYKAYNHAFSLSSQVLAYEWCAVIDIDEYIALRVPKGADQLAGEAPLLHRWLAAMTREALLNPDVFLLNWMFASPVKEVASADTLMRPLPGRHDGVHGGSVLVKSIFKPSFFLASQAHHPVPSSLVTPYPVRGNGSLYDEYFTVKVPAKSRKPQASYGAIIHFFHKTIYEYIWKKSRNTGDQRVASKEPMPGLWRDYATHTSRAGQPHRLFKAVCEQDLGSLYAELLNDSHLMGLLTESVELMQNRFLRARAQMLETSHGLDLPEHLAPLLRP